MIVETEKFCDMPCTSWRASKASDVIYFQCEGLRTNSASVQEQENVNVPTQNTEHKFGLYLPFLLFETSGNWMMPCTLITVILSTQSTVSNANLFLKHPTDTTWNKILLVIWSSLSPVKLRHNINHYIASWFFNFIFLF